MIAKKIGSNIWKIFIFLMFSLYAFSILYPLAWMVISSLKTNSEFFTSPWGIPAAPQWHHYYEAVKYGVADYFFNSVFVTVCTVIFSVLFSAMASYIISRFDFKLKNAAFIFILGGLMISPEVTLVSLFKLLQSLKIYNTLWALIVPYTAFRIPFTTFLMRSYMLSIPKAMEESAYIDGCSTFKVFTRIILPVCKPIVASAALLSAMTAWNEFMFALVFIESNQYKTIPIGLTNLKGQYGTNYPRLMAALVVCASVMIILFLCFQKSFVRGLTAGSVKG